MSAESPSLQRVVQAALDLVSPGMVVGLGSGRASTAFIHALGDRVKQGLPLKGVPTSLATEKLARELGIPLVSLDDIEAIDIAVDGADEIDPQCNAIKGYGAALVREKVVAAAAKKFVVLVGDEKLVPQLGSRGRLPVEIIPFAHGLCRRKLTNLGLAPNLRLSDGKPLVTDNGNWILDCGLAPVRDAACLERDLLATPGVLGTGLFLGMIDTVLISRGGELEVRHRHR